MSRIECDPFLESFGGLDALPPFRNEEDATNAERMIKKFVEELHADARYEDPYVRDAYNSLQYCAAECEGLARCRYSGYMKGLRVYAKRLYSVCVPCSLRMQAIRASEMSERVKGLIVRFKEKSFEDFVLEGRSPSVRAAYMIARATSANGRSLVLAGAIGTGKTHLASAIAKEAHDAGRTVVFSTAPEMMSNLRSFGDEGEYDNVMRDLLNCSLLVIDDVGAEKMSQWCAEQYFTIVNSRYNGMRQTVITTNIETPNEMIRHFDRQGEKIVSRLCELCKWILIKDTDWRKRA